MVPVFKNVGKDLWLKLTILLVIFLLTIFGKRVCNRLVDHLETCSLFFDNQYDLKSFQTTADLFYQIYIRSYLKQSLVILIGRGLLKLELLLEVG